jgi:ribosome-associated heat shock protein Hsp15
MDEVRVDKWLWAARFFKSRSLAATACDGGKVDVNGHAAKPAKAVRPGDHLEITVPNGKRLIRVLALCERRGSATLATTLYEDLTPAPPPRAERRLPPVYRSPGAGRPTKRERRLIDRLSGW